jgi:hypothetical protein
MRCPVSRGSLPFLLRAARVRRALPPGQSPPGGIELRVDPALPRSPFRFVGAQAVAYNCDSLRAQRGIVHQRLVVPDLVDRLEVRRFSTVNL